jgi:hypothetical protein
LPDLNFESRSACISEQSNSNNTTIPNIIKILSLFHGNYLTYEQATDLLQVHNSLEETNTYLLKDVGINYKHMSNKDGIILPNLVTTNEPGDGRIEKTLAHNILEVPAIGSYYLE